MFYNDQRCAVDVVNHMLRDVSCQSKSDCWEFALFAFLLNMGSVNAQTILKYNINRNMVRRSFIQNLVVQLCMPWLQKRSLLPLLRTKTKLAIRDIRKKHDPTYEQPPLRPPPELKEKKAKCYLCKYEMQDMKNGESRSKMNRDINYCTWFFLGFFYGFYSRRKMHMAWH